MREHILEMDLYETVNAFERHQWKFFEVDKKSNIITVEARRGTDLYKVILGYDEETKNNIVDTLKKNGFIKHTVKDIPTF